MSYGCFLLENMIRHLWLCNGASAVIGYVKFTSFGRSWLTQYELNPVFVPKTKATSWCPQEQPPV